MQANNIMNADMLDILFEHKNKAYGAYNLRRTYDKRLYAALGATFAVGLLFTISTLFAGEGNKKTVMEVSDYVLLNPLEEVKKKEQPIPEVAAPAPPAAAPQVIQQIRVTNVTPPRIVRDDQVTDRKSVV